MSIIVFIIIKMIYYKIILVKPLRKINPELKGILIWRILLNDLLS